MNCIGCKKVVIFLPCVTSTRHDPVSVDAHVDDALTVIQHKISVTLEQKISLTCENIIIITSMSWNTMNQELKLKPAACFGVTFDALFWG